MIRVLIRTGLILASVAVFAGCEPVKPIRSYSTPKPELVYETNHVDPGEPEDADGNPLPLDDRMLTALIPHGDNAWFVKLSGPKANIAPHVDAFQAFVKSFKFAASPTAEPQWQLTSDWVAEKPDPAAQRDSMSPVYAIVTIGKTNPPLEIRISSLPLEKMDLDSYILPNVNRWRRQLSLPALVMPLMKKEMQKLTIADGSTAYYFDMLGKLQAAGMPGAQPMAGHPPIATNTPAPKANGPVASDFDEFKFTTPAGWQAAANDQFSQAAFEVGEGPDKVRVTFSALGAAANDLTSNVNRWRAQVDLPPQNGAALQASVDKMEIGGAPGSYVELIGPTDAIIGAIVLHDNKTWFLKLRGPKAAAQAQQTNFRELLKSIRFK